MAAQFFKKITPTRTANLDSLYPDLYDNGKTTFDIQIGGNILDDNGTRNAARRNQLILIDAQLADKPVFGDSTLVGAKLGLYTNSIKMGDAGSTPAFKVFKNSNILGNNEGGHANNTMVADANVAAFSFHLDNFSTISETFDSFSEDTVKPISFKKISNQTVAFSEPYLTKNDGYFYGIHFGRGKYSNKVKGVSRKTHFKRYGTSDPSIGDVYYIENFKSRDKFRTTKERKLFWFNNHEEYKSSEIKDLIKFKKLAALSNENGVLAQGMVKNRVNENNSIFHFVGREQPSFEVNDAGELNMIAFCDTSFSEENVLSDGSVGKMSAFYPSLSKTRADISYGKRQGAAFTQNRQVTFMTTPIPTPTTTANMWQGTDVAATPTIEIDFNVEKMAPLLTRTLYNTTPTSGGDNDGDYEEVHSNLRSRLNRCFAITCSEDKPMASDDLYTFMKRMQDGTGNTIGNSAKNFFGITYFNHEGKILYNTLGRTASGTATTYNTSLDDTLKEVICSPGDNNGVSYDFTLDWNLEGWVKVIITMEETERIARIGHFEPDGSQSKAPRVEAVRNYTNQTFSDTAAPKWLTIWLVNFPCLNNQGNSSESGTTHTGMSLVGNINNSATTITAGGENSIKFTSDQYDMNLTKVVNGTTREYLNIVPGNKILVDNEVMLVTARQTSDTSYTVIRGVDQKDGTNTAAASHDGTGSNADPILVSDSLTGLLETGMAEGDTESIVFLDAINFNNFNGKIHNATICTENELKGKMTIPEPKPIYTNHNVFGFGNATIGNTTSSAPDLTFAQQLMPSYLAFGFNQKEDVENGTSRFLLLNGYNSTKPTIDDKIFMPTASATLNTETTNIRAGFTTNQALGKQQTNAFFDTGSGGFAGGEKGLEIGDVAGDSADTQLEIGIKDKDTASVEQFSQKGLIVFNFEEDSPERGTFTKRECIYASARVIKVIDTHTIRVDSSNVLDMPNDETFILYKYNNGFGNSSNKVTGLKIVERNENDIKFQKEHGLEKGSYHNYLISAERFWVVFEIYNMSGSVYGGRGANETHFLLPEKSYESALLVTGAQTFGATYNETKFNDGQYIHNRQIELFDDSDENSIVFNDYGFGEFDEETNEGGHLGFTALNKIEDVTKYIEVDISGAVTTDSHKFGDVIPLVIGPDSPDENYLINIDSENGTNKPYVLTTMEDELPKITNFELKPNEQDPFFIDYTWSCQESDVWYGFLHVSDEGIQSQYHGAVIHVPMNDEGPDDTLIPNGIGITGKVTVLDENGDAHGTFAGVSSDGGGSNNNLAPKYDIEGLAGYNFKFSGNQVIGIGTDSNNVFDDITKEMSVVAHVTHDTGAFSSGTTEYILSKRLASNNTRKSVEIFGQAVGLTNRGQIVANIHSADGNYVQLKSSTLIPQGVPLNIIVTLDANLYRSNGKLFINGKLEDETGEVLGSHGNGDNTGWIHKQSINSGNSRLFIGSNAVNIASDGWTGKIEEVVLYNKLIYPVNVKSGKFNFTKPLEELTAEANGSSKPYEARLFVKDYHNIRGKTGEEVANTPPLFYKKASFNLNGVAD